MSHCCLSLKDSHRSVVSGGSADVAAGAAVATLDAGALLFFIFFGFIGGFNSVPIEPLPDDSGGGGAGPEGSVGGKEML